MVLAAVEIQQLLQGDDGGGRGGDLMEEDDRNVGRNKREEKTQKKGEV